MSKFWDIWRKEYLIHLKQNQHPYGSWKTKNCIVPWFLKWCEIVLICDKNQCRKLWNMGMIQKVYKGDDGVIRSCEIRHPNRKYSIRSIQHLYPFEISQKESDMTEETEKKDSQTNSHSFLGCNVQNQKVTQTSKVKCHFCLSQSTEQLTHGFCLTTEMNTPVLNELVKSKIHQLDKDCDELEQS